MEDRAGKDTESEGPHAKETQEQDKQDAATGVLEPTQNAERQSSDKESDKILEH